MSKVKFNPTLLKEAENTLFNEVFCVTDKEIQKFLNADDVKAVNEATGEKPIGKLTNLQVAFLFTADAKRAKAKEKMQAFNALDEKVRDKQFDATNAEVERLREESKILSNLGWKLVRSALGDGATDTVGYRKGGTLVSIPEKKHPLDGLFDGMFPGFHVIEVGVMRG